MNQCHGFREEAGLCCVAERLDFHCLNNRSVATGPFRLIVGRQNFPQSSETGPMAPRKMARLNPCIGEWGRPVLANEEEAADNWHNHGPGVPLSNAICSTPRVSVSGSSNKLGSTSEVECFRLQIADGLLVKRDHPVPALQLFELQCHGPAIGRVNSDEDPAFRLHALEMMRGNSCPVS